MQLRITGLEQVQRRLREAPAKLVQHAFAYALDRAAGVVAAEVEARMNFKREDEGLLRENQVVNVVVEPGAKGGTAAVGFSHARSERTGKPADLIALWVEYGHRMVSHDGTAVGEVQAYPFMRPAAEASAERALQVFQDALIDRLSVIES